MQPVSAGQTETIDIVTAPVVPGARWTPRVGAESLALLDRLRVSPESRQVLLQEATAVLARCVPSTTAQGQETGLVIGHVQSGKTMSFTTVAALARDNGYRLIIVLSGLTTSLFEQSRDRLKADLQTDDDRYRWLFDANPRDRADVRDGISIALGTPERTVLLTVMKNTRHLNQLSRLLSHLPLRGVPVLVIDDEADQASLNNEVRRGGESATYSRLVDLRRLLPHHTFLQYTATPQAPLLINLIDVLSPRFVEVITPGSAYAGGRAFFEGNFDLVRPILDREVPTPANRLTEPPESLLRALRVYFLGVAAGRLEGQDNRRDNRSMMIHPSKQTPPHASYRAWVREIKHGWARLLDVGRQQPQDPDYLNLLADFRVAYEDLSSTLTNLLAFEDLLGHLRQAIEQTLVVEMNSSRGRTPQPNWHQHYAHILVGGEVLNRGFTVEGLTVSYMPRGLGTGQADTIQQRARWFGYKEEYLGYCRVYLTNVSQAAYRGYIDHEEQMRQQLREFAATGQPLTEWKRAFFLSPQFVPTRHTVLDLDYERGNFANNWFRPSVPHDSEEAVRDNRDQLHRLLTRYDGAFQPDPGDERRTDDQRHLVAVELPLADIYRHFLVKLRFTDPDDSAKFTGLLLQVDRYLGVQPDATCVVYQMKAGRTRQRGLSEKNEIKNLFQGRYPNDAPSPADWIYPGDERVRASDQLTIQLHLLDLDRDATVVAREVLAAAVWVPRQMSANWISQHQA